MGQYKFGEMEKICHSLRNDVGVVGKLSQEIDTMAQVIQDRDSEIKNCKAKYSQYNTQAKT